MITAEQNREIAAKTKVRNIPFVLDKEALYGLVTRIAGSQYAERIIFVQMEPSEEGMDRYIISDTTDGKIQIEATSGVAAANAFRWYLENRCDSYVGPLNRRLNFPQNPPAVGQTYSGDSKCLYRYFLNYFHHYPQKIPPFRGAVTALPTVSVLWIGASAGKSLPVCCRMERYPALGKRMLNYV